MGYKAVINDPSYLCHFNKNHDPKNGRFTFKKAWETIDTAVSKGYDAVEKVAKGAYRGIKKEFKNPSNSDFDGYSAPKISATPVAEKVKSTNPNDYRTSELDKKYDELKKSGVLNATEKKWLHNSDNAEEVWGKDFVKAIDNGIKALSLTRYNSGDPEIKDFADGKSDEAHKNSLRSWFMFEDQTIGMPEVAYLVNSGWSKDKIMNAFKAASEMSQKNDEFYQAYMDSKRAESKANPDKFIKIDDRFNNQPYKNLFGLEYGYDYMDGNRSDGGELGQYIDACIEVSNRSASHSLTHFNPYHDRLGRFDDAPKGDRSYMDSYAHFTEPNTSLNDFYISPEVEKDISDLLNQIDGYTTTEVINMTNPDTGEEETYLHRY